MKERLQELIARYRHRCDYLEIRVEENESFAFAIKEREMRGVTRSFDRGAAIRACHRGGWGFASINSLDDIERFIESAVEQARQVGRSTTELYPIEPVDAVLPLLMKVDPRTISLKEKVALFTHYNDYILTRFPAITMCSSSYSESVTRKWIANSDGTSLELSGMDMTCGIRPIARRNGVSQFTYVTRGSSNNYGVMPGLEATIDDACGKVLELVAAPSVQGGKYPVILDPHLGGTFVHEAFGHFSEADDYMENPQMRETFPLGRTIGSDKLTIFDTGLDVGTRGYVPYDDEGVPGQKTMLIENGILVGRLHNRESAARFNEPPTGSARAKDYHFSPICRMRNTCIGQGTSTFGELLEGIDLGVYAISSIGGHGGEMFSFTALYGYMIRNGAIAEMVRDVSISGNLFTTLMNIDMIGNDFTIEDSSGGCGKGSQFPLPVTSSSPHFRISEATVGGV